MFRNSAKTLVTYIKPDQIWATRATCAIHWCHLRYSSFPSLESNEFPADQHIFSGLIFWNQIQLSHAQSSKPESMNWLQLSSKLQNFHESLSPIAIGMCGLFAMLCTVKSWLPPQKCHCWMQPATRDVIFSRMSFFLFKARLEILGATQKQSRDSSIRW